MGVGIDNEVGRMMAETEKTEVNKTRNESSIFFIKKKEKRK